MRTRLVFAFSLILALQTASAFALPGEDIAVIQHCGVPHAENRTTSQVTNKPQRDLIYNDIILHFEPLEGGWSFTTAWRGHFPVTRNSLEKSLPCFHAAMQQVAAAPPPPIDPTIARQAGSTPMSQSTWGIPFLWLVVALVVTILIMAILPRRRRKPAHEPLTERPYRRPTLRSRIWKPRPPNSPLR